MDIQNAYNSWAVQYDSNINKTRDLEAAAIRRVLADISITNCLEIGCGTGKNTSWLITKARHITGVDLSPQMLEKARKKINSSAVTFTLADINNDWDFATLQYDLITFSLVLEHIEHLEPLFAKVSNNLFSGGHVYVGELHPFKQYTGSKARFDTDNGTQVVPCFNHHLSDFISAAKQHDLTLVDADEYFDDNDRSNIPRILTLLFVKK